MTPIPSFYLNDLRLDAAPYAVGRGDDTIDLSSPDVTLNFLAPLLLDGEVVDTYRYGNRVITVPVIVEGSSLGDIAEAERDLMRVCANAVSFTVDPGGGGPVSVWRVMFADPKMAKRSDAFEAAGLRPWNLELTCLPWARPETPSTVTFTNAGATNGLLTVPVGGSQRTHAKVTVRKTAGGGLSFADLYVYSDPTLATHGWIPNDPTTWHNCPSGPENSYTLWAKNLGGSAGAWREITISNASAYYAPPEVVGSRVPLAGMGGPPAIFQAIGVANLGGVYDPVLGQVAGTMTFAATVNSSPVAIWNTTLPVTAGFASLILTRNHPDAAFTNVLITGSADSLILMPPRLGRFDAVYDGVVFKTGTTLIDATDRAVHHAPVVLTPDVNGQSVVWVSSDPTVVNSLTGYTVEFEFYEQHNGWVA